MESLKPLEQIIINAKKSLGRPYTVETIEEKKLEIQEIEKDIKNNLIDKLEEEEKKTILGKLVSLKKEAIGFV